MHRKCFNSEITNYLNVQSRMLNQQIVGDRGEDEEGEERGGERKMQRGRGSGGGERENEQKGLCRNGRQIEGRD